MLDGGPRSASAMAQERTVAYALERQAFLDNDGEGTGEGVAHLRLLSKHRFESIQASLQRARTGRGIESAEARNHVIYMG